MPSNRLPDDLIGDAPEHVMFLDGISCRSLADSGSQVSSVFHSFFIANFSAKELVDCSQLLGIQGVGGAQVPYHGYFYVEVGMPLVDSRVLRGQYLF